MNGFEVGPNQKLQQTAAAILVSRDIKALSAAAAAELCRSAHPECTGDRAGTMRWLEMSLALRFIVMGATFFVVGAVLAYFAKDHDPHISAVGVIIFVAGVGVLVLGFVLWPRPRGAEPGAAADGEDMSVFSGS